MLYDKKTYYESVHSFLIINHTPVTGSQRRLKRGKNVTMTQVMQCYTEVNVDYVKVICIPNTVRIVLKTNCHEAGLDLPPKHRRDPTSLY
jgi:hypothetical protein